jgi:hypothetical protein
MLPGFSPGSPPRAVGTGATAMTATDTTPAAATATPALPSATIPTIAVGTATQAIAALRAIAESCYRASNALEAPVDAKSAQGVLAALATLDTAVATVVMPNLEAVTDWARASVPAWAVRAAAEMAAPAPAPKVSTLPPETVPAKPGLSTLPAPTATRNRNTEAIATDAIAKTLAASAARIAPEATPAPVAPKAKPATALESPLVQVAKLLPKAKLITRCRAINGLLHGAKGYTDIALNSKAAALATHIAVWGVMAGKRARLVAAALDPTGC